MAPRKLYLDNVRVGDEIPAMAKAPIDRVQLVRYAGATNDFNPVHIDEPYAKSLGMPSVYAPSSLGMGFLGQLISDWARGATLRKFGVKFVRIVWPQDTLVCKGRVSDRYSDNGRYFLDLEVWAENQKGELALKGSATLQVFYSSEDEHRFKMGQPPVNVVVARTSLRVPEKPPAPEAKKAVPSKPSKPAKPAKPAAKAAPKAKPAKKKK